MTRPKRPEEVFANYKIRQLISVINDSINDTHVTLSGKYIKEKFFLCNQEHVDNDEIDKTLFLFYLSGWDIQKNVDKVDIESFEYTMSPRYGFSK